MAVGEVWFQNGFPLKFGCSATGEFGYLYIDTRFKLYILKFLHILKKYLFYYQPNSISMKVTQPFFTLSHIHFSQIFLSMNVFSYSRQLAQGMLALLFTLATVVGVNAQACTLSPLAPFSPVPTFDLPLSATPLVPLMGVPTANATFNANVASAYFQSDCSFTPLTFRIYTSAVGGATVASESFQCANVGPYISRWVTTVGLFLTESPRREVQFRVVDITNPSFPVMPPVTTNTGVGATTCGVAVSGINGAPLDNCTITKLTWAITGVTTLNSAATGINQASGTVFNVGVSTVTYTATDASGNTGTTSFTVTVNDNTVPVITCPDTPINRSTDAGICTYTYTNGDPLATATDNCPNTFTYAYTLTGATTAGPLSTLVGQVFNLGTTNISVTATAANGVAPLTTAPCLFSVVVADNQAPAIGTVPGNLTLYTSDNVNTPLNLCDADTTWTHPTVSDNCSVSSRTIALSGATSLPAAAFTSATTASFAFNLGVTTVTYLATDANGLTSTKTFTVTVLDNAPPSVTASNQVFNAVVNINTCDKDITWTRPSLGAPQDCGPVKIKETFVSGPNPNILTGLLPFDTINGGGVANTNFPAGTTVIRYSWIDNSPASADFSVLYTFIVTESVLPVAACQNISLNLDANGTALMLASAADNGSSDNCPAWTVTVTAPNGSPVPMSGNITFDCGDLAGQPLAGWPYTLTVTDASNNTNSATCTIKIVDNAKPLLTCPANLTVSTGTASCLGNIAAAGDLSLGIFPNAGKYDDNCDITSVVIAGNNSVDLNGASAGTSPLTFTGTNPSVSLSGAQFGVGTTNLTYTITDQSGNVEVCNFIVVVKDNVAPVATGCPTGPVNVQINTVSCSFIPTTPLWNVTFADPGACSLPVSVVTTGGTPTSPFPQGENPITITATDASGNVTVCSFIVDVADFIAPDAKCKTATVNLSTPTSLTPAQVNNNSTDNCTLLNPTNPSHFALFALDGLSPLTFTCTDVPSKKVVLRVTDRDNNSDTCQVNITVVDNILPICATQSITRQLSATNPGSVTVLASEIDNSSSDNCGLAVTNPFQISLNTPVSFQNSATFTCAQKGANAVFLRVTDKNGNTSSCAATVTIQDVTPPVVLTSPAAITVNCDVVSAFPTVAAYVATLPDATFGDNCAIATINETFTTAIGTCPNAFTITRTWTASDTNTPALTVQAVQIVVVQDITKPVITTPVIAETLNLSSYSVCKPVKNYTATVTDNCSVGNTTTWSVEYANNTNPTGADEQGTGTTTAITAGFATGINVITFTSTDQCGNSTSKTITVTVVDDVKPVFASYNQPFTTTTYCGKAFVYDNTAGICGYTFQWVRPWNGDITDCSTFSFSPESIMAVTQTGSQNLSVNPVFTWDVTNSFTELVALSLTLPVGTTTFTYNATDAAMNTQTCSFTVKVNDVQPPTLTGSTTALLNSICPTQQVPDYTGLVNVMDNCPQNVTLTQSILSPVAGLWTPATTIANVFGANPILDNGTFVVRITANDGVNPPFNRDITVTLDDNTAPIPTLGSLAPDTSLCGYIILDAPTANPNCTAGNVIYGTPGGIFSSIPAPGFPLVNGQVTHYRVDLPPSFGCTPFTITWTYNDGNNNTSSQPQQVLLCPDVTPPVAKCKTSPISITLSPITKSATLTTMLVDNASFDPNNCNPFTLSLSKTNFTCADVSPNNTGATTVTMTASQTVNNVVLSSQCTVQVKVIDNTPPVFVATSLPANVTVDTCSIGYVLSAVPTVTAVDSCSAVVSFVQSSTQGTSGASKYNYIVTRTWTATDVFGNTATASRTITIRDVKKPEFALPSAANLIFSTAPVTTTCDAATTLNIANIISDCAPDNELTINVSPAYFSLTDLNETLPVGSHVITLTATDPSGNSATASLTIVVKDATKPAASCINGISVALNANGQAIVTPNLINNQSSDNCTNITFQIQELEGLNGDTIGNPAAQLIFGCSDADNDTKYPIILWVKDAAGNFNFCETNVVIQDNVAPVLTCPANLSVSCETIATATLGVATAVDNCNNNTVGGITYPVVTVTPSISGTYLCQGITRTFKAVDLAGNSATCTQVITVTDTKPPVFTVKPPSDTLACNDPLINVQPVLSDNCTPTDSIKVVLTEVSTKTLTGCTKYNYTTTRTWVATDKCGNSSTHTQILKIEDKTGPKFTGMPDTINVLTANFPVSTNCSAPVTLNAAQFFDECALLTECTINSITFSPTFLPSITPTVLNVSGNYPVGTTKVFFTVTDPCGNIGKDSVTIIVKDNSTPVAKCDNISVVLSNNGQATITPLDVDNNSFDNCGLALTGGLILDKTQFDCEDLGANVVVLTAKDIYGNVNTCQATVTVTAGANSGFDLVTTVITPTYFGATNGSATAAATGGSNNFAYVWNTGATTATLSGVAAGTYTVAVSDQFSGCQKLATVVVPEGPKVKFSVGSAAGAQNTIIKVPVTVDNFQQISGFTFTLNVPTTAVGAPVTPIALTNINPLLGTGLNASVNGNVVSVLYLNGTGSNVNLPQGSLLFNLCIQLSNATLGTSSPVNIENAPVQFQVLRGTTIVPADQINGSVQITQGLNEYDIKGDINPWQNPTTGIPNVTVTTTGPTPALTPFPTTTLGIYQFDNIVANTNTTTSAVKKQSGNNKIDIIDQGLLLKHIFATSTSPSPLTSPYQRVAADVNFDGQINIIDFALIQRLLLGTVQNLEGTAAKDWVFIPKSYTFPTTTTAPFPNPVYAALPVFPQTIGHTPLFQDQLDDDFVGVRMGDLNGDAPLNLGPIDITDRNDETLKLRLQDRTINAGETVQLAFKAKDFVNQNGFQLTFAFDPNALELQEIQPGTVPGLDADANFGTTLLSEGFLSTAWINFDATTIADDETLFTLVFKATTSVNALSQALNVSNEIVNPMAVQADGTVQNVEIEYISAVSSTGTVINQDVVLYQNQPNPFVAQTTIGFRLPANDRCAVRIYASNGRLVKTIVGNFEKGYNAIQLQNNDLGGAGVYYYELTTPSFSDRKKMVLID